MKKKDSKHNLLLNEVFGVVLVVFALFLMVSLLSYDPYDTPYHASPPNEPLHNFAGQGGAHLSEFLYFYLGWGSLFLPVVILLWGLRRLRGGEKSGTPLKILGSLLLVLSTSCLFSLSGIRDHLSIGQALLPAGGFVGLWMGGHLTNYLGGLVYLISILGILLGLILRFNFSIGASLKLARGLVRPTSPPKSRQARVQQEVKPQIVLPKKEKEKTGQEEPQKIDTPSPHPYQLPSTSLLNMGSAQKEKGVKEELLSTAKLLEESLGEFGVEAKVVRVNQGPTVTRLELQPAPGVKVARIVSLSDDIALTLATPNVRIETPIPGKQAIGIEIPNRKPSIVHLREILESPEFIDNPSKLAIGLGKDLSGQAMVIDLIQMPHLLIAGATGSGKSICINAIIASILYRATPEEVKLMLIDPKRVEFTIFKNIPHLIAPLITDAKKSTMAVKWLVNEMEERYRRFAQMGVRDVEGYNRHALEDSETEKLPYIVMIIDELADLMMVAMNDCEDAITRLAQMSRAVGIHLVLATQRPSVDVITGIIKANLPSRIAFQVSSKVDSRTILDMNGAEKLLGAGDMLFAPAGAGKPLRLQGSYISLSELEGVVRFIGAQKSEVEMGAEKEEVLLEVESRERDFDDELYGEALRLVSRREVISASMLQRRLRVGYNRAARLIEAMEEEGIVDPQDGAKPRRVHHDKLTKNQID